MAGLIWLHPWPVPAGWSYRLALEKTLVNSFMIKLVFLMRFMFAKYLLTIKTQDTQSWPLPAGLLHNT